MKFDRKTFDQRPGAVPDIRAEGDSVLFYLQLPGEHARLIIRCQPDGTIAASIDVGERADFLAVRLD